MNNEDYEYAIKVFYTEKNHNGIIDLASDIYTNGEQFNSNSQFATTVRNIITAAEIYSEDRGQTFDGVFESFLRKAFLYKSARIILSELTLKRNLTAEEHDLLLDLDRQAKEFSEDIADLINRSSGTARHQMSNHGQSYNDNRPVGLTPMSDTTKKNTSVNSRMQHTRRTSTRNTSITETKKREEEQQTFKELSEKRKYAVAFDDDTYIGLSALGLEKEEVEKEEQNVIERVVRNMLEDVSRDVDEFIVDSDVKEAMEIWEGETSSPISISVEYCNSLSMASRLARDQNAVNFSFNVNTAILDIKTTKYIPFFTESTNNSLELFYQNYPEVFTLNECKDMYELAEKLTKLTRYQNRHICELADRLSRIFDEEINAIVNDAIHTNVKATNISSKYEQLTNDVADYIQQYNAINRTKDVSVFVREWNSLVSKHFERIKNRLNNQCRIEDIDEGCVDGVAMMLILPDERVTLLLKENYVVMDVPFTIGLLGIKTADDREFLVNEKNLPLFYSQLDKFFERTKEVKEFEETGFSRALMFAERRAYKVIKRYVEGSTEEFEFLLTLEE